MQLTQPPMLTTRHAAPGVGLIAGLLRLARWLVLALLVLGVLQKALGAGVDFLPPEQAFQVSGRLVTAGRAEVLVQIAPGYYVYRDPFRFSATGAVLGPAQIPPGKVKFDENFQKSVETYRDTLHINVPLTHADGPFSLQVVLQGCADAGLCYPPMTSELHLNPAQLAAAGDTASTGAGTSAPAGPATTALAAAQRSLPGQAATAPAAAAAADASMVDRVLRSGRLWQVVGVFFGLGLLLSLTPCVLPMLPILSSLIVGLDSQPSRWRGLALASAYALGMAMVYTALGVVAGLAGEGFAAVLQTPWALGGFALLLAVFALSMFDVYELRLPARFTGQMAARCNRLPAGRVAGVFLMGGVSALIVSPCVTAPLAGALLFISQSGDVVQGGAALFSMAGGMSMPLLLLGASAGRWVPRAGAWMHGVKRLFGVLMLAVALWVAQPVLPIAAVLALWGLLLLLTGFLLRPFSKPSGHRHALRSALQRTSGAAALLFGAMQIVGAGSGGQDPLRPLAQLGSRPAAAVAPQFQVLTTEAAFDAALAAAAGRPVMLDFYADWCVSCKEMERFTFSDAEVAARLAHAVLLKVDVTANTESQRSLLRRFKLFGPPGTLFFDTQGREVAAARVVGFQSARKFHDTLSAAAL